MNTDALYDAAIAGDVDAIAKLETKADRLNEDEKTILHIESEAGNAERVRFIVREFARKNLLVKLANQMETALISAAYYGHTEVVEVLIDGAKHLTTSANPVTSFQAFLRHADQDLETALNVAVRRGHTAIAKLLVEADPSDTHVQNKDGKTPLYNAAEKGYNKIVMAICKTCATPSLDGPGGSTALHAAISNIHKVREEDRDVIRTLINVAKRSHESFEAIFNRIDEKGHTILELAVEGNHVDVVELILQEDPAYGCGNKKNDLICLINKAMDKGYKNIVKVLSNTYEGINPDHKGVIDLILAIIKRDKDSVLSILKDATHLANFVDDQGWTPLHYAAYHEFDFILEDIIKAQKEVRCQFLYQDKISTPFHVAAEHGCSSTVILLIRIWIDQALPATYTAINGSGQNVLHIAAAGKRKEMIHGFLKYCPQRYKDDILNQQDANGNTPLHILISTGCFIPELIKYPGLDITRKNKKNWTSHDMLYLDEDIVADQVRIKYLLDSMQTNKQHKFWDIWCIESSETKPETLESTVLPSRRARKDAKFKKGKKLLRDRKDDLTRKDLKRYSYRTNTQILVAALITTVAFTAGFIMPGGLHQSGEPEKGLVVLSGKKAFNAFMILDALALLLSTSSLLFYFLQSMDEDLQQVSKLDAASIVLNIASIIVMMLTFITGTYSVLSHSPSLAIMVCVIGSLFFLVIVILQIKMVYDCQAKKNVD